MTPGDTMRRAFEAIYRTNAWGGDESVSGPGSGRARTALFRDDLVALLRRLGVRSLLDAAGGDFHRLAAADRASADR